MSVLISWDIVTKLMNCFPNSVINHNAEFIAHIRSNTYFGLKDCENEKILKNNINKSDKFRFMRCKISQLQIKRK